MITIHQPQRVAPAGVFFRTSEYAEWDFGDSFDGIGDTVAHVYTEPGVYSVTARLESGAVYTTSVTIDAWAGETWAVAEDGNFLGQTFDRQYTDYNAAMAAYLSYGQPAKLLLKGGRTYVHMGKYDIRARSGRDCFHLGSFGSGSPTIDCTQWFDDAFVRADCDEVTFSGIDFRGGWDAATETGEHHTLLLVTAPGAVTFHECTSDGFGITVNCTHAGASVSLSECHVTNWQGYGILAKYAHAIGITNSAIEQSYNALPGPLNRHGPVRITLPSADGFYVVDDCSLRSLNGWSYAGALTAHQACMRWNVEGVWGARLTFTRNMAEGGWSVLDLFGNTSTAKDVPSPVLVQDCDLIGTANTYTAVRLGHSGARIRGNRIEFPSPVSETNKAREFAFVWEMDNPVGNHMLTIVEDNLISGVEGVMGPKPGGQAVAEQDNGAPAPEPEALDMTITFRVTLDDSIDAEIVELLRQIAAKLEIQNA